VYRAHTQEQCLIVLPKFAQHIGGSHELRIVVGDSLQTSYVSDGSDRRSTDLADPFGYVVGDGEYLASVIVKKQVVVAKMSSAHMPMEVLGLEVKGEYVRKQGIECSCDVLDCLGLDA
jgi:hypothetical protein